MLEGGPTRRHAQSGRQDTGSRRPRRTGGCPPHPPAGHGARGLPSTAPTPPLCVVLGKGPASVQRTCLTHCVRANGVKLRAHTSQRPPSELPCREQSLGPRDAPRGGPYRDKRRQTLGPHARWLQNAGHWMCG